MKKIVLTLVCVLLFQNQALAEASYTEKEEKKFVLAVLTGIEGERQTGTKKVHSLRDRTPSFYISTKKCKNDACIRKGEKAFEVANNFAKQYNELIGKDYVNILPLGESSFSAIPIFFRDKPIPGHRKSNGWWYCSKGFDSGLLYNCKIDVRTNSGRYGVSMYIVHEMMNALGINDTEQDVFNNCLVFNAPGRFSGSLEMCEIEKKVIIFKHKHLRPGMRVSAVSSIYDKHWKKSGVKINKDAYYGEYCERLPAFEVCKERIAPKKTKKKQHQLIGNK